MKRTLVLLYGLCYNENKFKMQDKICSVKTGEGNMNFVIRRVTAVLVLVVLTASVEAAGAVGRHALSPTSTAVTVQARQSPGLRVSGGKPKTARQPLTREELAGLLAQMTGIQTPQNATYKGVHARPTKSAVVLVTGRHSMTGFKPGYLRPQRYVSRQEFAVVTYNYMKVNNLPLTGTVSLYKDDAEIADGAKKAVYALTAQHIMQGENQRFYPHAIVSRGAAVRMLQRVYERQQQKDKTVSMTAVPAEKAALHEARRAVLPVHKERQLASVAPVFSSREAEQQVFGYLRTVYGSIGAFAADGVLYWQGNVLHIGCKSAVKRAALEKLLQHDEYLQPIVAVKSIRYSIMDYQQLTDRAKTVYLSEMPQGTVIKTGIDYTTETIVLTVPVMKKSVRAALQEAFGANVRCIVRAYGSKV